MTLIEKLTEQTQSLKIQYLKMTKNWAKEEFTRMLEKDRWSSQEWGQYFGIEMVDLYPGVPNSPKTFPRGFYNTQKGAEMDRMQQKISRFVRLGESEFVSRMEKNAITHYEGSIQKLALRIQRKGLNEDNLELKSSHIGVNFETLITDGSQTVRAWTIIASGPVQRPHYRYLVK